MLSTVDQTENVRSFIEIFEEILLKINTTKHDCILSGDFNINLLQSTENSVKTYINLLASHGYQPCINKPTRVNKSSATIIDHIWTNNNDIISQSGILLTDVSDHFSPFICCQGTSSRAEDLCFSYRDYNNIDERNLCQTMKESIDHMNTSDSPDGLQYITSFLV